jgi:hypothetical protein
MEAGRGNTNPVPEVSGTGLRLAQSGLQGVAPRTEPA